MFKRHRGLPTTTMLFARALVGGYLVYLAIQLLDGLAQKDNPMLMLGFGVLFLLVGAAALYFAARDILKGNYQGGANDFEDENVEAQDVEAQDVEAQDVDVKEFDAKDDSAE